MRVSTGSVIGVVFLAVVALGGCGGAPTAAPPTTGRATGDTTPRATAPPSISTIPTLPPTTKSTPTTTAPLTTAAPPTTAAPTTSSSSTSAAPTTVPPSTTTVPTASAQPCKTLNLTASLSGGGAAAGTFYSRLTFRNDGSTACTLFGYPGVSYVRGSTGIQTGDPADRYASISGASTASVVTLAAGGTAHAVLAEVDVANYPPATCRPIAVRGLRVYPPDQTAALFVPQTATGCEATGVRQLGVGFIVP